MIDEKEIKELERIAKELRIDIVTAIYNADSGHPAGSLSAVEILTVLYFKAFEDEDDFILSPGHLAPLLYAVLAKKGFFSLEELRSLRKIESRLEGHPTINIPGVKVATGSLGQGLSVAVGMALAKKLDNADGLVYCLVGDGEIQEGQVWEAAMAASHYRLNNLVLLLNHNHCQLDGPVKEIMNIYPIKEKFEAFGWNVKELEDQRGHDLESILNVFNEIKTTYRKSNRPFSVIFDTIKGRGVSYMETNPSHWHGRPPNYELTVKALKDIAGKEIANYRADIEAILGKEKATRVISDVEKIV